MLLIRNLSIARKLAASFTILVVLTSVIGWMSYAKLSSLDKSAAATSAAYRIMVKMEQIMGKVVDQETGVRGYLISGDRSFLAPYQNAQAPLGQLIDDVRALLIKPDQVTR